MASLQELSDIRRQIADIQAQITDIESASLTKDDVETRIRGFVQSLQSRFDAGYIGRGLVSAGAGINTTDLLAACSIDEHSTADRVAVLAAWLHPELLEQKLMDAAQPYIASGKSALPADRRPALIRKLDEKLSGLLNQEEELIVELTHAGHEVFRRGNIDPLVVLGK